METTHQDLEHGAGAWHWGQGHHHGLGLPSKERQGVWREMAGGTPEPWAAALLGGGGGDREGRWGSQRTGSGGKNQCDTRLGNQSFIKEEKGKKNTDR